LTGNIFGCASDEDLPVNDPSTPTYSCGSNAVNDFLIFWFACFAVFVFIMIGINANCKKSSFGADLDLETESMHGEGLRSLVTQCVNRVQLWNSCWEKSTTSAGYSNLGALKLYFATIRGGFVGVGFFSVMVLFPVYTTLSLTASTYSNDYVWTVSAALHSGKSSALILFFTFLALEVSVILFMICLSRYSAAGTPKLLIPIEPKSNNEVSWSIWSTYVIVTVLDVVVFGAADICYVYIVITYSATDIAFAAMFFAGFKIVLSKLLVKKSIPSAIKFKQAVLGIPEKFHSTYQFIVRDITFLELLVIVNHVILPIIAILVILPDCFYNAFVAAENVSSSLNFESCSGKVGAASNISCVSQYQETSFTPPFIYSYQCSSNVLINYVSIYIMKFIYIGFLRALRLALLRGG
jgi:hypothetical protein